MNSNNSLVSFKLNDQFYDDTADGNIMNAYAVWFDRGVVSAIELREYARRTGIIDENTSDVQIEQSVDPTSIIDSNESMQEDQTDLQGDL